MNVENDLFQNNALQMLQDSTNQIDLFSESMATKLLSLKMATQILKEEIESKKIILNIPSICEQIRNPIFPDEFYSAYEQLIQTLNFPVIQPKITEEQLEKQLEKMDDKKMNTVKIAVSNMVKSAPIESEKKSKFLTSIKSTGKEIFTATVSTILATIIMNFLGCDSSTQNIETNNTVINNYSYSYNSNTVNYNHVSSYEIHYNEDSDHQSDPECHSIKEQSLFSPLMK